MPTSESVSGGTCECCARPSLGSGHIRDARTQQDGAWQPTSWCHTARDPPPMLRIEVPVSARIAIPIFRMQEHEVRDRKRPTGGDWVFTGRPCVLRSLRKDSSNSASRTGAGHTHGVSIRECAFQGENSALLLRRDREWREIPSKNGCPNCRAMRKDFSFSRRHLYVP